MDDKKKLDEAASLNISVSEDGVNHNYTWSANDLDELSQLLRMSGIDGTKQVTNAILTADAGGGPGDSVSFRGESSSANMAKIMAIIDGPQAPATFVEVTPLSSPDCACESIEQIEETQAPFDHGTNPTSRKGYEYDIEPADFQGRAGMPNRLVNNYGDNAMDNSDVVENKAPKLFADYLREAEEDSRAPARAMLKVLPPARNDHEKQYRWANPEHALRGGGWEHDEQTGEWYDTKPDKKAMMRLHKEVLPAPKNDHEKKYRENNPEHALRSAGYEYDPRSRKWNQA